MSLAVQQETARESCPEQAARERDALVERLLQSVGGAFDIFALYLGDRLGFYQALAAGDALTSVELADRTGTHERYVREWLEQQTVTGIVEVQNPEAVPVERRFRLPAGHAEVLADTESLDYMAPLAQLLAGAARPLDRIVEAYQTGGGVPFAEYGTDLREGQARINRSAFLQLISTEWLPAMPDVHARLLQSDPAAWVADIGCGEGWSCIGIAQGYPSALIDGFDIDEASVEAARTHVREAGLSGRIAVDTCPGGDSNLHGLYDLVTAFECVHDMSDPVRVLQTMRRIVREDGAVLVVDERVGDTFTPRGNDVEWMMYGWSVLHCLPVGMADQPSAGTGTVMRADTLRGYALEAGFREVEVLPVEHFFFRFYRLYP